jgi:hypothetical protein
VLADAVGVLPPSYQEAVGADLLRALQARRDELGELALEYYGLLAGRVDVYGTEGQDSLVVTSAEESGMRVRLYAIVDDAEEPLLRYDRTFLRAETDEVRIYLWDGEDRVSIEGPDPLPIDVRIVGAAGDDRYVDRTSGERLLVYDDEGSNTLELGRRAVVTAGSRVVQDSIRTAYALWHNRDWGSAVVPRPEVRYDSDLGLFAGFGLVRYAYGWGHSPYRTKASLSVLNGLGPGQWIVDAELDRPLGPTGWRFVTSVDAFTDRPTWLFGFGNDTPAPESSNDFRSFRSDVTGAVALHYRAHASWMAFLGVEVSHLSAVQSGSPVFDELEPYGSGQFDQAGLRAGVRVDTRDSESMPTSGIHAELRTGAFPSVLDVREAFATASGVVEGVLSAGLPGEPALTLRLIGERAWGRTPYHELPALGGSSSLPGFVSQRFLGHTAASASGLLRVMVAEPTLFTDLQLGLHGLATAGRVWATGEESDTLHRGVGGGLWLGIPSLERVVSFTAVSGDDLRLYLDFGFIF